MRILLVGPLAVLLALEVWHSARRNGWRFTGAFFGGAFVFGVIRANIVGLVNWLQNSSPPYAIVGHTVRLGFSTILEPVGWAFALYGSWFLAEGMLRKASRREPDVFGVSFLACFVMAGFAYAVEAAATPMNWWHWATFNVGSPYVYATPVIGIFDWATVSTDFLFPFLAVMASRWGRSRWSMALFGLVVAHHLGTHLFAIRLDGYLQLFDVWHWLSVWALGAAALLWPLPITAPAGRTRPAMLWRVEGEARDAADALPFVSVAGMLAVVLYAVLGISGDLRLLWSVVPLAAAWLLALPGVPIVAVLAALVGGVVRSLYAVPALLEALLLSLYAVLCAMRGGRVTRAAAVALAVAGLALYLPWAHARSNRLGRLMGAIQSAHAAMDRNDYAGAIADLDAAYGLASEFAGGEDLLATTLYCAWAARDRQAFDGAARRFEGFGPQYRRAGELWDAKSEEEFDALMRSMRPKRGRGVRR